MSSRSLYRHLTSTTTQTFHCSSRPCKLPVHLPSTPHLSHRCNITTAALSDQQIASLRANSTRLSSLIHSTATHGAANRYGSHPDETGLTRLALSPADRLARDWFVAETKSLGCEVTVDAVGNIFAVRPGIASKENGGKGERRPATFAGSHLDSQPTGGRYDGVLGVCAGVEILRVLEEEGIETRGDVGVVNWTNEEGARWGVSMMGSGVWSGANDLDEVWALRDQLDGAGNEGRGRTVKEELEAIGYLGSHPVGGEDRFHMAAHFELHIEQARRLEELRKNVGVVKGVQGYTWLDVVVKGKQSHAGTTRFEYRADALFATSRMISTVRAIAVDMNALATVGTLELRGGASINTVPGEVHFTIDLRHPHAGKLEQLTKRVKRMLVEFADKYSTKVQTDTLFHNPPTIFDKQAMACIAESAQAVMGTKTVPELTSGAGHDSVHTSKHCPTAMIFVPCKDGLSHHPEEFATEEASADGASVLLQAVVRWDRQRGDLGD
ncbi:putative hydrolase [Cyphellophora attinorum]|uniref:Putative hydrolase n=1 Tax=Cyphellophora attinorum TaxID=1664694 RepID=A0A0N1P2B5_9EURO|nr:putative hydrolase [Phialophora attinorum]KPI43480.1 putative hydrolase [Phialophora attinorum]